MASPDKMKNMDGLYWDDHHLSWVNLEVFEKEKIPVTFGRRGCYPYKLRRLNPEISGKELDRQEVEIQYRRLKALVAGKGDSHDDGALAEKVFPTIYEIEIMKHIGNYNGKIKKNI